MNNLQHPSITVAEKYGYPKPQKVAHQCSECGEPIYEGETAYSLKWGWVCENCMMNAYVEAVE